MARVLCVLADSKPGKPAVLLLGTRSEVQFCPAAHEKLVTEGVAVRVVSMPCWELFERLPQDMKDSLLPPTVQALVSVEQASGFGWERYVGAAGEAIGINNFGAALARAGKA